MDSARFDRLRELFHTASGLPEDERDAFLDGACMGNPELLREAQALLAHDAESADSDGGPEIYDPEIRIQRPAHHPTAIGPYKILEVLGEGGMGIVFKAEQTSPVVRIVALKLVKSDRSTPETQSRFDRERRIVAAMNHSCIAKILDAGTTDHGQSYFVMEYVEGLPLTAYCDANELTLVERLRLFHLVCQGVEYAHYKGVVHRDLKKDNILVTLESAAAMPKILDFGLAKSTEYDLIADTEHTAQGQILGTPEYMSPEQVAGEPVDQRTDVYALGVVMYELLTGQLPFDSEQLRAGGFASLHRIVTHEYPDNPSRRAKRSRESVPPGIDVAALIRALRGDLDWIVMKAIEKKPEHRYLTAGDLAEDVRRYLDGEPVEAPMAGMWCRLQRWGRRHQPLAIRLAAFSVFVVLLWIDSSYSSRPENFGRDVGLVLLAWTVTALVLDHLVPRWARAIPYTWCAVDLVMLTGIMYLDEGASSPLTMVYPLLVASSGLWLRPRIVFVVTVAVLVSYGLLVVTSDAWRTSDQEAMRSYRLLACSIAILGLIVGILVRRLKALRR